MVFLVYSYVSIMTMLAIVTLSNALLLPSSYYSYHTYTNTNNRIGSIAKSPSTTTSALHANNKSFGKFQKNDNSNPFDRRRTNNSNSNNNNNSYDNDEDEVLQDASYQLARDLAARRGLNVNDQRRGARERQQQQLQQRQRSEDINGNSRSSFGMNGAGIGSDVTNNQSFGTNRPRGRTSSFGKGGPIPITRSFGKVSERPPPPPPIS